MLAKLNISAFQTGAVLCFYIAKEGLLFESNLIKRAKISFINRSTAGVNVSCSENYRKTDFHFGV